MRMLWASPEKECKRDGKAEKNKTKQTPVLQQVEVVLRVFVFFFCELVPGLWSVLPRSICVSHSISHSQQAPRKPYLRCNRGRRHPQVRRPRSTYLARHRAASCHLVSTYVHSFSTPTHHIPCYHCVCHANMAKERFFASIPTTRVTTSNDTTTRFLLRDPLPLRDHFLCRGEIRR